MIRCTAVMLVASSAFAPACAASSDASPKSGTLELTAELLNAPEDLKDRFSAWQIDGYRHVLEAFQELERSTDSPPKTIVARCRFIEHFAYADLDWIDVASDDLQACQEDLQQRHPHDPEAQLYRLENQYGADAAAFGGRLLSESKAWSPAQRARLHAGLSDAYEALSRTQDAGEHALQAVELDPGSRSLARAILYLGARGGGDEARTLAAGAPIAEDAWLAAERIRALQRIGEASAALAEFDRHRDQGIALDERLAARALVELGRSDDALVILQKQAEPPAWESIADRWLRFDLALAMGHFERAAEILALAAKEDQVGAVLGNYARLVRLKPAVVMQSELLRITGLALLAATLALLAPGLILLPAHYRGLVRRIRGAVPSPLFPRIGLRHAWWAASVFLIAPILIAGIAVPTLLPALIDGASHHDRSDWAWFAMLGAFASLLLLWPVWRRFSVREWMGSCRGWGGTAIRVAGTWIVLIAVAYVLAWLQPAGSGATDTEQTQFVKAVVLGLNERFGLWAAIAVLALLVPLVEELVFRGALLGGLARHVGFGWANAIQAVLFALGHDDPPRFLFYLAMALLCGWLARSTQGLLAPIALHGLNNALFAVLLVSG